MIFGIILLAIAAILLVWFVAWFIITRVNGNCPLCAMEKIARPSKLTIDTAALPCPLWAGPAGTPFAKTSTRI